VEEIAASFTGPMTKARPLRVVVTGSECTGKTTLAAELAARFAAPWSKEYVREYQDAKGAPVGLADVEAIAAGQIAAEETALRAADALVFHDTDVLSTVVYSRHYNGACPRRVEEAARERRADLYLLLRPDLPWVADAQRDRPLQREEIHALFEQALLATGARVVEVEGTGEERRVRAERAVRSLLAATPGNPPPARIR
jgi:NadR type nicotinamide-nucleotide adenylyltransferase